MKKLLLVLCFGCLLPWFTQAQVKMDNQWKCDKPTKQHSLDIGDRSGHAYSVDQFNCTPTQGDINGTKRKSGVGTEFVEAHGDQFSGHGEFVETMENGDRNFYTYQMKGTMKNGALQAASNKWSLREGGGKMKGGKASGTCTGKGNPDQSTTWDCTGDYTIPK